jgi:hypothetical protein
VLGKPNLSRLYKPVGLEVFGIPLLTLSAVIGGFEMLLGVLCLEVNAAAFFVFVCAWKLETEFSYIRAQVYGGVVGTAGTRQ